MKYLYNLTNISVAMQLSIEEGKRSMNIVYIEWSTWNYRIKRYYNFVPIFKSRDSIS